MTRKVPRFPGKSGRDGGSSRKPRNVPPPPANSVLNRLQIPDRRPAADPTPRTRQLPPPPRPVPALPPLPQPAPRREPGEGRSRLHEWTRTFRTPSHDDGMLIDVAMMCAATDRPFILKFRERRGASEKEYWYERTLTEFGAGGASPAALSIPVRGIDWIGITCPYCGAACAPVLCEQCNKLVCDGRVTRAAGADYFRCADSCGASGLIRHTLTTINGSPDFNGPRMLTPPAVMGQAPPKRFP